MSIKIIADTLNDFPENLRSEAKEVDGKFELDGDGVVRKNSELLKRNAALATRAAEAEAAKETADASAAEWRGKAKIPTGSKLVTDEIAELGEAAKASEIGKDEMPTLKTAKTDLQKQIDSLNGEKQNDAIADGYGWKRDVFKRLANGLPIVTEEVKEGDKTVKKHFVVSKDANDKEVKTEVAEDANFKPFIAALRVDGDGKRYLGQESGNKGGASSQTTASKILGNRYKVAKKD